MKQRLKEARPFLIVTAVLAFLLIGCAWALAEQSDAAPDGIQINAQIGYDGAVLCGRWNPLCMEFTAGDSPFEGYASVDIGVKNAYYDRLRLPITLDAGETRVYRIPVQPLIEQIHYEVMLEEGGVTAAQHTVKAGLLVPEDALVIGVLGGQAALCDALSAMEERSIHGDLETIYAVSLDEGSLSDDSREMEAFDALVFCGDENLTGQGRQAVEAWQKRGGILIQGLAVQVNADAAARAILDEIKAQQKAHGTIERESYNYPYGEGLNNNLRVNEGEGILGTAILLGAYALLAGGGLYLLMKRLDRSKDLWFAMPAVCVVLCALLAVLGAGMEINKPVNVSAHVTHIDEEGSVRAQELALLNMPSQERVTVTTEDALPIGRMEYTGYSSWAKMEPEEMELRDVITLGDEPAIELIGQATWKKRALLIEHDAAPKGKLAAEARMEADGLHIEIENGTDQLIRDAVVLTELGFATLGDLAAGDSVEAVLRRTDAVRTNKDGLQLLEEGVMAAYPESLYRVMGFCVDPETAYDEEFRRNTLDEAEQSRRVSLANRLNLAGHALSGTGFECVLIGETPDIACQKLLIDGKAVERSAQISMLIRAVPFETQSASGYFYYPQETFARMEAAEGLSGMPVMGGKTLASYTDAKEEVLFGFELGSVARESVERIGMASSVYVSREADLMLEVFNHQTGAWEMLTKPEHVTLEGEQARAAINEQGEIFFRYTGEELNRNGVRLPEITVEGKYAEISHADEAKGGETL